MELLAVRLARVIVHFPTEELNPRGRALVPEISNALVERYGFLKYPTKYEDFDDAKGIKFDDGRWNDIAIQQMTIHTSGLVVDTRSSTDDSEAVLTDALDWATATFGLTYRPDMLNHKIYVSELVIRSGKSLDAMNPALKVLADRLTEKVRHFGGRTPGYETSGITLQFDPLQAKYTLTSFRLEKLEDVPFSDNKYFSSAPLPTNEHISLLEEFEAALKG